MKELLISCLWLTVSLLGQSALGASNWAVDVDPTNVGLGPLFETGYSGVVGWTFILTEPVTVTGLGWFDQDPGGLVTDHQIGIWQYRGGMVTYTNAFPNTNGPLLFSAVVPAGTNAPLSGGFREVDLATPMTLPIGYYVIAGTYYSPTTAGPDAIEALFNLIDAPRLTSDPRIQIGGPTWDYINYVTNSVQNPQLLDPNGWFTDNFGDAVEVGPNFLLVPLPSLRVTRIGNALVLSWSAEVTNFVLESSTVLGANASWASVTNAIALSGGSWVATNTLASGAAYYRLRGLAAGAQSQFTWTTNNGTITITLYTGPGGAVTIPSTITGLAVTSIGKLALNYCDSLTSIVIPNSILTIGDYAFLSCANLTSVVIPDSVISIGDDAFSSCAKLTSLVIPTSVVAIGDNAFSFCGSLTNVVIPDSVTSIGDGAFLSCGSLTGLVIPNSVTSIGESTFSSCGSLTNVMIPDSVITIGDDASHPAPS